MGRGTFLGPTLPGYAEGADSHLRRGGGLPGCDAQHCVSRTAVAAGRRGDAFCASAAFITASRQGLAPSRLDGVMLGSVLAEAERGILLQIC